MKRVSGIIVAGVAAVGAALWAQAPAPAQRGTVAPGDWATINRDLSASRYSPLAEINVGNVGKLSQAWTFALTGGGTSVPLAVNGVMYVSSGRRVVALDGDTGKEIWAHTLEAPAPEGAPAAEAPPSDAARGAGAPGGRQGGRGGRGGGPPAPAASARGVGYWPGDATHGPRVLCWRSPAATRPARWRS